MTNYKKSGAAAAAERDIHELAMQLLLCQDKENASAAMHNYRSRISLMLFDNKSPLFDAQVKTVGSILYEKGGVELLFGKNAVTAEMLCSLTISESGMCLMTRTLKQWGEKENDNFFQYHLENLRYHIKSLLRKQYAERIGVPENQLKNHTVPEGTKSMLSIEEIIGMDEDNASSVLIKARNDRNMISDGGVGKDSAADVTAAFLTAVAGLARHRVRKGAPNYPLLLATEYTVSIIRSNYETGEYTEYNETDIMQNIDTSFLDHFESAKCRSTQEIALTKLKKYGDFSLETSPEKQNREIALPLEGFVYTTYLHVTPSAISHQKTHYESIFRELLKNENV